MISIGSFIVQLDSALVNAADAIVAHVQSEVRLPLVGCTVLFYVNEGIKAQAGDPRPFQMFLPRLLRTIIILTLVLNMSWFNQWFRDALCYGPADWLTGIVSLTGFKVVGGTGGAASVAAAIDALFGEVMFACAKGGQSFQIMNGQSYGLLFTSVLAAIFAGGGMLLAGVVWLCAKMSLAIMVCLGPILISCGLFDVSRPMLERAIGKIISVELTLVVTVLMLSLVMGVQRTFMQNVLNDGVMLEWDAGAMPQLITDMCVIVIWFLVGSVTVFFLPHRIAYSIGGGVVFGSGAGAYMAARALLGAASVISAPSMPSLPNMSGSRQPSYGGISLNRGALAGGPARLPPAPPPPALSYSNRS